MFSKIKEAWAKERLQKNCPHDWREVLIKEVWASVELVRVYDLYCPICELEKRDVSEESWRRTKNIHRLRKEYEVNQRIARKQ